MRKSNHFSPELKAGMDELSKNLYRQQAIANELASGIAQNPNALTAERDALEQRARDLAKEHHQDLVDTLAGLAADDWLTRIKGGNKHDFDTRGPSSQHTRGRVMPAEADQIMRDYMITNPRLYLPLYFESSARRSEYARLFGPTGGEIDRLIDVAVRNGMHGDDAPLVKAVVENITGRASHGWKSYRKFMSYVQAFTTAALLPRAALSSLSEPATTGISMGGTRQAMGTAMMTYAYQVAGIFRTAGHRDRAIMADMLGAVSSAWHESVMAARDT